MKAFDDAIWEADTLSALIESVPQAEGMLRN